MSTLRYFREEYDAKLQPALSLNGRVPLPLR
jgi:hypothetical protein